MHKVSHLALNISKHGKRYVAYAPALDIATSGKTKREVEARFHELVTIFLEELQDAGTLDTALIELGWTKVKKQWAPPLVETKAFELKVPALI